MKLDITKEWFERHAHVEGNHEIGAGTRACCCIGPQNGQPLCPCMMRGVTVEDGRYVRREDLGPAPSHGNDNPRRAAIWAATKSLEPKL